MPRKWTITLAAQTVIKPCGWRMWAVGVGWAGAWFCLDTPLRCRMLVATVECDCCYSHCCCCSCCCCSCCCCCCRQQQLQFSSKKPGQSVALEQLTGRPLGQPIAQHTPTHPNTPPGRPSTAKNVSWSGFALDTRHSHHAAYAQSVKAQIFYEPCGNWFAYLPEFIALCCRRSAPRPLRSTSCRMQLLVFVISVTEIRI